MHILFRQKCLPPKVDWAPTPMAAIVKKSPVFRLWKSGNPSGECEWTARVDMQTVGLPIIYFQTVKIWSVIFRSANFMPRIFLYIWSAIFGSAISSRPFFVSFARSFSGLPISGLPFSAPLSARYLYLTNQRTEFQQALVDDVVEATDELIMFWR